MVRDAIEALGRLDFLANNAGTSNTVEPIAPADMDKLTEEFWSTILTTNLIGPFRCTHAAAAALKASRRRGVQHRFGCRPQHAGLQHGLRGEQGGPHQPHQEPGSRARAAGAGERGAPGFVDTEWTKPWPAARKQASIERTLLKRACTPDDIAAAIVFLCADTAMVTAQTLVVDGGYSL